MARLALKNKEAKRLRIVKKYAAKRQELKVILADMTASEEAREVARKKIMMMPRDANPCRLHNRCRITGRPHGYYRRFGLGRNKLREAAMQGLIPGLVKASW